MADQEQEEAARRRETAQREQSERAERERTTRARTQQADSNKGGGEMQFSDEEDPRSEEDKLADIEAHNQRATEMQDEALEEQLSNYDPEKIGHRLYGGMDIIDTRNSQSRFSPPPVQDPNLRAKQQIAEENREFRPGMREEAQAFERNRSEHTSRAEVIARR